LTIGAQDIILPYVRADDRLARKPNGLAIGERASETADLAISFGAVPNGHDRDFLRRYRGDDRLESRMETRRL
jgi:hypothetical protein